MIDIKDINFDELRESADKASHLMRVMANADRLMLLCQLSQGEKMCIRDRFDWGGLLPKSNGGVRR